MLLPGGRSPAAGRGPASACADLFPRCPVPHGTPRPCVRLCAFIFPGPSRPQQVALLRPPVQICFPGAQSPHSRPRPCVRLRRFTPPGPCRTQGPVAPQHTAAARLPATVFSEADRPQQAAVLRLSAPIYLPIARTPTPSDMPKNHAGERLRHGSDRARIYSAPRGELDPLCIFSTM